MRWLEAKYISYVMAKNANFRRFIIFERHRCHFFRNADDFENAFGLSGPVDLQMRRLKR